MVFKKQIFSTRTNPSLNGDATSNLGSATEHTIGANGIPLLITMILMVLMSHVQMVRWFML